MDCCIARRSRVGLASPLFFATAIVCFAGDAFRPWTAAVSVAVRYFVERPTRNAEPWNLLEGGGDVVVPSPDGAHFFVVTFSGDLAQDRVTYELSVYDVASVRQGIAQGIPPAPVHRLAMAAPEGGNWRAGLIQPCWETESAILFLGQRIKGHRQLFRYDLPSKQLLPLTSESDDPAPSLISASHAVRRDTVLFTASRYESPLPADTYPSFTIKDNELSALNDGQRYVGTDILLARAGTSTRVLDRSAAGLSLAAISPDESKAILVYPRKNHPFPSAWNDYELRPEKGHRFILADLIAGTVKPLFDAPGGTVTNAGRGRPKAFDAFWSHDSRHVVLYNTSLPLDQDRETRRRMAYVIDYAVQEGTWKILCPMADAEGTRIASAEGAQGGDVIRLNRVTPANEKRPSFFFQYNGHEWEQTTGEPPASGSTWPAGFTVTLRQDPNNAPVLVAAEQGREISLTEPDPALANVQRQSVEPIAWTDAAGNKVRGLLTMPAQPTSGRPPPVVIQACDLRSEPHAFRPDGSGMESGYALQALAAKGFAVLQMDSVEDESVLYSRREGPAQVERIDSAIDYLAKQNLIDPARVGLVGFSRSGYLTYYTITHPGKHAIAAACVFDSITSSYGEYVATAGMGDFGATGYSQQYGTPTFWQNKTAWLDAPSFNVERCRTPVLFSAIPTFTALETVGAFRLTKRPFEFRLYPNGTHILQMPRERASAIQATVDWMCFWMLDQENPGSQASDVYARWRMLKADWIQTQASEKP